MADSDARLEGEPEPGTEAPAASAEQSPAALSEPQDAAASDDPAESHGVDGAEGSSAGAAAAAAGPAASSVSATLFSAPPNNSAEAADALELGRSLAEQARGPRGDDLATLARAERMLARSVRMRPTTESMQLLAQVQRRQRAAGGGEAAGGGAETAAAQLRASASAGAAVRPAPSAASVSPPSSASPPSAASSSSRPQPAPSAAAPAPARPPAPAAAAAAANPAAAGAGAAGPAPAPAPGGASPLLSFAWDRCTFQAPSFMQPPARPGVPPLRYSFSYPAFLYIPPAQRRPLLFLWALVLFLALGRWVGMHEAAEEAEWARQRNFRRGGKQRGGAGSYRGGAAGSYEHMDGDSDASDGGGTWSSTSYSRPHIAQQGSTLATINNLLSLLPFIVFFAGPLLQRYMQQQQRR